ncbi:MAG: hypothetical protein J7D61_07755 [Marichromatium sp.]|nr:hypothetical protein [Marichromatium sp.]
MGISLGSKSSKDKSKTNTTSSSTTTGGAAETGSYTQQSNPWDQQAPYLQGMFQQAWGLMGNTPMGSQERDAYSAGHTNMQQRVGDLQGAQTDMSGQWDALKQQQQQQAARYDGVVDNILGTSAQDMQQQAAQFAGSNPYLDQAIEQSNANASRMLGQTVGGAGGINHQAASAGNMSSSRAGVAEGVARSEYANQAQQNELALRQNAYDQGLGQANQLLSNRMAMSGQLQSGVGDAAALLQGQQAANQGYYGLIDSALQQQLGYAQGQQGGYLDQQRWQDALQNAWGIIGSNNWGGTESGYSDSTKNAWEHGESAGTSNSKTKSSGSSAGFSFSL